MDAGEPKRGQGEHHDPSWGGMGVMWGRTWPSCSPSASPRSSWTPPAASPASTARSTGRTWPYLGRVSGRDEDKIAKVGFFEVCDFDGAPAFTQARDGAGVPHPTPSSIPAGLLLRCDATSAASPLKRTITPCMWRRSRRSIKRPSEPLSKPNKE